MGGGVLGERPTPPKTPCGFVSPVTSGSVNMLGFKLLDLY